MFRFEYIFNFDTTTIFDELNEVSNDITVHEEIVLSIIEKRLSGIERSLEYFASELNSKLEDIDNRLWRVEDKTQ